jgi:GTPase SAR1 family protein
VKQVPIPDTNIIVELYIFDCAGQSMFNQLGMNAKYYEDASAVMVIYDVSNHDSLKSCGKWLEGVKAARKGSQGQSMSQPVQTPIIGALVGNKKDYRPEGMGPDRAAFPMRDSRAEVSREEAQRIGADLGLAFFETSAVILSPCYVITRLISFQPGANFSRNNFCRFSDE